MKIGWIGVGNMGKPMAKHIQEFATEFTVCDLNQEAAAEVSRSCSACRRRFTV